MLEEGGTLSAQGASAIDELEAVNLAQSVTLRHAWLAGSKMNLSEGKILDLVSDADLTHVGVNSTLYIGDGVVALESDTAGPMLESSSDIDGETGFKKGHVFTNTDWSAFFIVDKAARLYSGTETSISISQYETHDVGYMRVILEFEESISLNWVGSTNSVIYLRGASPPMGLAVIWLTYSHSTRTLTVYNAFTGVELGSTVGADLGGGNAWPTDAKLRMGTASNPARLTGFGGLILFNGDLNETKRNALFAVYYDVMTRFARRVLFYGNSTAFSDASAVATSCPGKLKAWLLRNNGYLWVPTDMGGQGLYHYRPADYELPEGREELAPLANRNPAAIVENYVDKRISIVIFDENQNTAANVGASGNVTYPDFVHIREAIADKLRDTIPELLVVSSTMIAPWRIHYITHEELSYEEVIADEWRIRLRDWSIAIRTDPTIDAVYDQYADFNLGWTEEFDGTPAIPETDAPNGNPDYFFDDPQHPGDVGQAARFIGLSNAILAVANENTMSYFPAILNGGVVLSGPSADGTSGQVLVTDGSGTLSFDDASGGVTDHGALTGLGDDDHAQYHNDARGDLRYQPLDGDLTGIAALGYTSGSFLLKKTAANTYALISLTSAGEALLDDANNAAQRTTLGLGGAAVLDVGTSAGTVAAGDHTHSYAPLTAPDFTGPVDVLGPAGDYTNNSLAIRFSGDPTGYYAAWQVNHSGGGSDMRFVLFFNGTGGPVLSMTTAYVEIPTGVSLRTNTAVGINLGAITPAALVDSGCDSTGPVAVAAASLKADHSRYHRTFATFSGGSDRANTMEYKVGTQPGGGAEALVMTHYGDGTAEFAKSVQFGVLADSAALNNMTFIGSDHSNKLCHKDNSGTVHELY